MVIRKAKEADKDVLVKLIRDSFRDVAEKFTLTVENCPKFAGFNAKERVEFKKAGQGEDILWMKQIEPTFAETLDAHTISWVLGLDKNQIDDRLPIQEVSTGLFAIIVPLKSLDAVKNIKINKDRYYELVEKTTAKVILAFCPETYHKENDLNVRTFCDYYGVPEDPATGSANGCLAGYLAKHRYFGSDPIDIRVEQGYEIGRPSLLCLKAQDKDGKIEVNVGGKVVMIAKGKLL